MDQCELVPSCGVRKNVEAIIRASKICAVCTVDGGPRDVTIFEGRYETLELNPMSTSRTHGEDSAFSFLTGHGSEICASGLGNCPGNEVLAADPGRAQFFSSDDLGYGVILNEVLRLNFFLMGVRGTVSWKPIIRDYRSRGAVVLDRVGCSS